MVIIKVLIRLAWIPCADGNLCTPLVRMMNYYCDNEGDAEDDSMDDGNDGVVVEMLMAWMMV